MPISKAATKALRNAKKKHQTNLVIKKKLKESIKNASTKNLSKVISVIDKAVKKNIIHKNKASRIKSGLYKQFGSKSPVKAKLAKKSAPKKKTTQKTKSKTTKKEKK